MTSSGDSSPDWLRSFKPPTPISPLRLSSDSESSHDSASFSDEYNIDDEESSPKSPKTPKVSKNKSTAVGGSSVKSSTKKTLEEKSLEMEDEIPSTKKKLYTRKAKTGKKEEEKIKLESDDEKETEHKGTIHSLWTLSSDSESYHDRIPKTEDHIDQVEISKPQISQPPGKVEYKDGLLHDHNGKSPSKKATKEKSSQKQIDVEEGSTPVKGKKTKGSVKGTVSGKETDGNGDVKDEEEETFEKPIQQNVSSSMLPLMLSEKVHRTKALIECQGDSIDLSGDMGAVGRVIVSDSPSGDQEMCLDLKGTIYKTSIVPCQTFCVVSFGQSEAKIEAIMNDYIQLNPPCNVYEAETMVEGTLDGFSFDSDEEAAKMQKTTHPTDQNEHTEEQTHGKSKRKADKTSGAEKKRGRSTGGKSQSKISKKKAPSSKRAKPKTKK
ncbi:DNA-binding protein bin4 [Trifolium pratense]|uniref:DNA-binding protein bin4 n=1 Tax=Trifolium pratense TaxID=57577 RepID=A0A2K3MNK8_TRIPR|nr:DNA-binding protein bin4 [Trifolium pratense]